MTGIDPLRFNWRLAVLCLSAAGVLGMALWPHPPAIALLASDAAQHSLAFGVLTLAARLVWPAARWPGLFVALSGFGLVIEVPQGLVPTGRNAELDDWLVDCAAIGAMLLAVALVTRLRRCCGVGRGPA